jgi:hypothetical protein
MGLDYHFFVQQRVNSRWVVPSGFKNCMDSFREELGYFTWFDDKDVTIHRLFVDDDAIFPLQTNLPPEIKDTLLFESFQWAFDEWYQGWIPFEEIHMDTWDEYSFLVSKPVPAQFVPLFRDGMQAFPAQPLLHAGCSPAEVDEMQNTWHYAYDIRCSPKSGIDLHQTSSTPMWRAEWDGMTRVSWEVSISQFMGEWRISEFQKLRQLDEDSNLRIICTFS